jgi:hypothetical protein
MLLGVLVGSDECVEEVGVEPREHVGECGAAEDATHASIDCPQQAGIIVTSTLTLCVCTHSEGTITVCVCTVQVVNVVDCVELGFSVCAHTHPGARTRARCVCGGVCVCLFECFVFLLDLCVRDGEHHNPPHHQPCIPERFVTTDIFLSMAACVSVCPCVCPCVCSCVCPFVCPCGWQWGVWHRPHLQCVSIEDCV